PQLALGFRRLAVIDLDTGNQPIALDGDRAVIVLNGEIYNFRELKSGPLAGEPFRTKGDVEVALRLYATRGLDAIRLLDGMFALAVWDASRETLLLARDRFGIKPLFFVRDGPSVAFGSELSTLLAAGYPQRPRLDPGQLRHYLAQRYPDPRRAPLDGVELVPPGTVIELSQDGERRTRYWDPPSREISDGPDDEALARLDSLLVAAVRRQLVADVPLGVFLSGGVDSGTIAAIAASAGGAPLKTFSVGFDDSGGEVADERPRAALAARHLSTEHHELSIDPRQVARDLPAILAALDGPLADPTVVPSWYLSALARREVVVALSGEGADELFGGYDRVRFDLWIDRIGPVGRRWVPRAMAMAGRMPSDRLRARLTMPAGLERQLDWSRTFTTSEIDALCVEPTPAEDEETLQVWRERARRWAIRALDDPINARLAVDRELFLPGDLLPKVDRMSMAHSLEVRVPFLDNELADFVLAQPGSRKIRGGTTKWMLRRIARERLPPGAWRAPKTGFDVPVSRWLRGPLREPLCELLSARAVRRRGLFRAETVSTMIDQHLDEVADHGMRLWTLLALEGWMLSALDRPSGSGR
ncbi:MAG TPA: asparagine synthase (glutamine-hydrolyzing), partial [Candidatus Polarisedimenticolaceae bacterium]|nr:asparagine synthase (glutamine-hydrolyzing) [Candidatus Polarisedimenticolaceae bacterium]